MIRIISSGPLTTLQDLGRFGYMEYGFSPSGAMDIPAAKIANILVDNSENDAVLEMTMFGITAVFEVDSVISLTGGDFSPLLNNEPISNYAAIYVKTGDTLKLLSARTGCRCYMAVAGGFDIPLVMGSFSTNVKSSIGGYKGRKISSGDVLPLRHSTETIYKIENRKYESKYNYQSSISVRVILGPQDDFFTKKGLDTFLSSQYLVSSDSDRMGIKLKGPKIQAKDKYDIISDGISLGSIQVPSSGEPIIMMSDRQTTGGYGKIATVITADIPLLAQAKMNDTIDFNVISIKEAQKILRKQEKQLNAFRLNLLRM